MAGSTLVQKQWTEDLIAGQVRLRCSFGRMGKQVLRFTVQLEAYSDDRWRPVVRYDNSHGFCHRDTLHADGTQDKTRVFVGDINTTFTHAIDDLKANWQDQVARYLKEISQ